MFLLPMNQLVTINRVVEVFTNVFKRLLSVVVVVVVVVPPLFRWI